MVYNAKYFKKKTQMYLCIQSIQIVVYNWECGVHVVCVSITYIKEEANAHPHTFQHAALFTAEILE